MIISPLQMVSIHTAKGVQLYQFLPEDQIDLTWSRDLREVSRAELTVATTEELIADIAPWIHHMSVWDETGQFLLWTGPLQKPEISRTTTKLSARDCSVYFTRTRCPIAERWDAADPADIADELVTAMIVHHGLSAKPVVRHDPLGDRFDYQAQGESVMLDSSISELTNVGLYWSVVSGTPIFGPLPRKPVAALGEDDFIGEGLTLVRDGSGMFNDVVLRAADTLARARVPAGGLSLQTIVNINSMFGVSNANKAAKQYVRYTGVVRDEVVLSGDSILHPEAPVTIDMLIPSARFTVEAFGILSLMELTGIEVTTSAGSSTVAVNMVNVNDELPELLDLPASEMTGL